MKEKINLKNISRAELGHFIHQIGEKPFRTPQIWNWIYQKGALSFQEMTDLSKNLREKLKSTCFIGSLKLVNTRKSDESKTQKFLWQLEDDLLIESVYIPEGSRHTICISSQVGCSCGCRFCATGEMGFSRNLKVYEIIDQVLGITREINHKPTNIVMMGMGEPLLNFNNLIKALTILNSEDGFAIGHRKITISTVGIVPMIVRYTQEKYPFKLAISLNATTDTQRSQIMPINQKYPLNLLLSAAYDYTQRTRRRITFEYVLIKNINDTPDDAKRLLDLLKKFPCKVNLIGFNPTGNHYKRSDENRMEHFAKMIRSLCAPVTFRLSKGSDIRAACGQLAIKNMHK